jgi:protein-S-isoprenylcysteine O-methyltransferase Ste14
MRVQSVVIEPFLRSFAFSVLLSLGYVLKNPALYNAALLLLVAVVYDRRAKYEEDILAHDRSYVEYLRKVRYRFVPGIY